MSKSKDNNEDENKQIEQESGAKKKLQAFRDLRQAVESNDRNAVGRVIAADNNTKEIREHILSARDDDGNTLLHIAASKGLAESTKGLVDWGADIYSENNNRQTAIELAESLNRGWGGFAANVATAGFAGYADTTEVQEVLKDAQVKFQEKNKLAQTVSNFNELPADDVVDQDGKKDFRGDLEKEEKDLKNQIINGKEKDFRGDLEKEEKDLKNQIINGKEKEKKIQKNELKKRQAKLGKQIRKDRLARIFGGEVSGQTREELRETQKMLGRVIRSDQMTGVVDKVMKSAANLKKKLLKGKSR